RGRAARQSPRRPVPLGNVPGAHRHAGRAAARDARRGRRRRRARRHDRTVTYSIAAWDKEAGQWGVATQSKFLAVGSVVPWAEPQVGAIATQAYANPRYGRDGLELLREGLAATEVVERLTDADDGRDHRQLGIVDA